MTQNIFSAPVIFCFLLTTEACFADSQSEKQLQAIFTEKPDIKEYDTDLNKIYISLLQLLSPQEKIALKKEQRLWISERNTILAASSLEDLLMLYQQRTENLKERKKAIERIGLSAVINDKETVDYQQIKADKDFQNCQLTVCKLYKAFIDFETSQKTEKDLAQAKEVIMSIADEIFVSLYSSYPPEDIHTYMTEDVTKAFLCLFGSRELGEGHIPLWLVLKHPTVLGFTYGRFSPGVLSPKSINDLPAISKLLEIINRMYDGNWAHTSYESWYGTIVRDLAADQRNIRDRISFTPKETLKSLDKNETYQDSLKYLKAWSLQGIWNRLVYKEFEKAFTDAIPALKTYYRENYHLESFADQADLLLSYYISCCFSTDNKPLEKAFMIIDGSDGSIESLKSKTTQCQKEDYSKLLHMAILSDVPVATIEWIISSGADVDHVFKHETPLMNAVTRPDVLKLLLNKGASVHAKTPMGKTALFYAVQFGAIDAVQILLEKGARVNDVLKSVQDFEKMFKDNDERFYLPETVADFTPLVYALCYASSEVIERLKKQGATLGAAPKERIKGWGMQNKDISDGDFEAKYKQCMESFKS